MATDFFQRQDAARRSTKWLVVMFLLGTLGVVAGTTLVAYVAAASAQKYRPVDDYQRFDHNGADVDEVTVSLFAGAATALLIGGGTLFRVAQLRAGGGASVAEGLRGRRVYPDTKDPVERRLLNVVEEMALASGVPAPPVYLLSEEEGINAFAAGYSPSDAVVAVTRGCAEQLKRDELQGVVAHEFSHILNGDMRLNIRLIGVLYGILLLGLTGRIILRHMRFSHGSSRKDAKGRLAVAAIAAALVVLGYIGTLIGGLIKAALSRQREYLADASAVQFTRNPGGLAGALKRIGARVGGSRLNAANAAEASHMYFAAGVWEGLTNLTATHPPLENRIRRLDPQWDGKFPPALKTKQPPTEFAEHAAGLVGGAMETIPVSVVAQAANQVGQPTDEHRIYAAALVQSLPPLVLQSAREPYGARAVLFGLLADRNPAIREKQLRRLRELVPQDVNDITLKLLPLIDGLDVRARLPLVDLSLPALRAMSPPQYQQFSACFKEFVRADDRLGLFEWTLYRILRRHLRPQFEETVLPQIKYYGLQRLGRQCSVLLSTLAHADSRGQDAAAAVARGAAKLPNVAVELLPPEECGLEPLSQALDDLSHVADKKRKHVVAACAACICADREVTVAEAELLRGVCDMLDCPMPPLLPGGPAIFAHDSVVA